MFKTILSLLLVLSICICLTVPVRADDFDVDAAFDFATEFLSEYYYAKDQCADYDFSEFIDIPMLLEYVNKKAEAAQYRYLIYDKDDKQDYVLTFELLDIETNEEYVVFDILADAKFRYKTAVGYTSEMADECFVIVSQSDEGFAISDWYTQLRDSHDILMRGELTYIDDPDYWNNCEDFSAKLDDFNDDLKQWYLNGFVKVQASEESLGVSCSEESVCVSAVNPRAFARKDFLALSALM